MPRRFVILESPFSGDVERNTEYAHEAMRHSLSLGEAPFASHMLYTQVLDDTSPTERYIGIQAGLDIGRFATATVVYTDLGVSSGMKQGISSAKEYGRPIEYRSIRNEPL